MTVETCPTCGAPYVRKVKWNGGRLTEVEFPTCTCADEEMEKRVDEMLAKMEARKAAAAGVDPAADAEFEASRPNCVACGDWDETVVDVEITRRSTAKLCASCAASDEVVTTLAAEDGLDEVDE